MQKAERHGEFIADLRSHRPRLRKAEVMGMRGCSATDDTGLGGNESQMIDIAEPFRHSERQFWRTGVAWVWFGGRLACGFKPLNPLLIDPLQHVGVVGAIRGLEIGPGGPEMSDRRRIARPDRLQSVKGGRPLEQLPERATIGLGGAVNLAIEYGRFALAAR